MYMYKKSLKLSLLLLTIMVSLFCFAACAKPQEVNANDTNAPETTLVPDETTAPTEETKTTYNEDGSIKTEESYINGILVKKVEYHTPTTRAETYYSMDQKKTQEIVDTGDYRCVWDYDENEYEIKITAISNADDAVTAYTNIENDSNGNLLKATQYDASENMISYLEHECNESGAVTKEIEIAGNGYKTIAEFDVDVNHEKYKLGCSIGMPVLIISPRYYTMVQNEQGYWVDRYDYSVITHLEKYKQDGTLVFKIEREYDESGDYTFAEYNYDKSGNIYQKSILDKDGNCIETVYYRY